MKALRKIVSGGQTGVDMAGLYAAQLLGLETGGWAAHGWSTEEGAKKALLEGFGLVECARPGYPARTELNVQDSHGTVIISHERKLTGGSYDTQCVCESLDRPLYHVHLDRDGKFRSVTHAGSVVTFKVWIALMDIEILNVAGPRKSKCPWLEEKAGEWLVEQLA